jgi:hypothetical protein
MKVEGSEQGVVLGRRAAEEQGRARVYAAKLRFELALAQMEAAARSSDSGALIAETMEQEARREFQRELENFANLIVRGELAGEDAA